MRCLFTNKSTFWLSAISRAMAFPVAKRLLTNRLALRLRVRALRVANRFFAHCVALRTSTFLTVFHWATHLTFRLVTLNLAFRAR